MPSSAFAPDEILPEDPGYYYSPLLPFRQKLNPDGSTTPGQGVEWGYVPGALRQAANQTWLAGVMPGNAAAGKYTPEQMNRLVPEAALGMTGLGGVEAGIASDARAMAPAAGSAFRTTPANIAQDHQLMLDQLFGEASRGAVRVVPQARRSIEDDIIGHRIDSLERPSKILPDDTSSAQQLGSSEIWGRPSEKLPVFETQGGQFQLEPVDHDPWGRATMVTSGGGAN